ncbi:MAG TPA: hypothetical protein VK459_08620, partial [Polyangiaceae bacterium]|nr:hypothetical protein [Polyangiaceae bacterium]
MSRKCQVNRCSRPGSFASRLLSRSCLFHPACRRIKTLRFKLGRTLDPTHLPRSLQRSELQVSCWGSTDRGQLGDGS